jgi:signal transduction histidine kinase
MRRRLLVSTVGVTIAVLLLLLFPILVVLRDSAQREEERRLDTEANRIMAILQPQLQDGEIPTRTQLLALTPPSVQLQLRLPEAGPITVGPNLEGDTVAGVSRPVDGASVRLASATRGIDERLGSDIVSLGTLVLVGVAAAAVLAIVQSRRLARPFEQLATAATRVGSGDFSTAIPSDSGIDELDNIGRALSASATRLDQMFAAERSFTGDATHQLRTGLTGISLRLEMLSMHPDPQVQDDARAALVQTEQLNETIDELLELARKGRAEHREQFDLEALVRDHVTDWQAAFNRAGRVVSLRSRPAMVVATPGFAGQVIDVLLSNSLVHGHGATVLHLGPHSVEISDDGPGIADQLVPNLFDQQLDPGAPHGRGLPLARRLAEADGGTLDLLDPGQALFRYDLSAVEGTSSAGSDS